MRVKEEKKLQDAFLYIRQMFFPKWDKTRKWIAILDYNLPSRGLCSEEKRQIIIDHIDKDEDQLLLTLIHEICHTNLSGHGKSWQERMLQKSKIAHAKGLSKLSELINKQVDDYHKSPKLTAKDIYDRIEDIMRDLQYDSPGDFKTLSYERLIKGISREYGLYPDEVKKCYKRSKIVFEKAKKKISREFEIDEKLRKGYFNGKDGSRNRE